MLVERFVNPRLLASLLLESMLAVPVIQNEELGKHFEFLSSILSQELETAKKERFSHLQPADPYFDTPAPVKIILGADVFPRVWIDKRSSIGQGSSFDYSTVFEWILMGSVQHLAQPI